MDDKTMGSDSAENFDIDNNLASSTEHAISDERWKQYYNRLAAFARSRIDFKLARADDEDIANSVLRSFYSGFKRGKFSNLDQADQLWSLLVKIALRKISANRRREAALKRGQGRVFGESTFTTSDSPDFNVVGQLPDLGKMPEHPEQVFASCDELLDLLPKEVLRQTALLRLQGYTNLEISEKTGGSVARVKQRVSRIRQLWETAYLTDSL